MDARHCPHCWAPAPPDARVCATCGAALPAAPARALMPSADQPPADQPPAAPYPPYGQPPYGAGPGATPTAGFPAYGYPPYGYTPYPYGYPPYGYTPYPYGYAPYGYARYPYGYPYPYPYAWPRPRRDTYSLTLAWIVLIGGLLALIGGLPLLSLVAPIVVSHSTPGLDVLNDEVAFVVPALVGGLLAVVFAIRRLLRKPSARISLPPAGLLLLLTALALAAGVALWLRERGPGLALAVMPLSILCGVLPALAILSLGAHRLRAPSTRRRVWLSLFYGATLAPLLASILELVLSLVMLVVMQALGYAVSTGVLNLTANPSNGPDVVALLIVLSVIAPLVEEGLKPLGAVMLMRRVSTPAEAFLLGLAAGIGFDMVETIGYIGLGEADWISVAIQRIGAGLLHGLGAAMAALGWYYLINGRGVRWRWLRGFGGLLYAVLQHAIFNASNLLYLVPGPLGHVVSKPVFLGRLPLDSGAALFFGYYLALLGVLALVTGRLRRGVAAPASDETPPRGGGATTELVTSAPGGSGSA